MTLKHTIYIYACAIIISAAATTTANTQANADDTASAANALPQTFISFDASLSVGAIPLFDMWQNTLPQAGSAGLTNLNLSSSFASAENDRQPLNFRVTESPENFNFVIPFGVSVHRVAHEHTWSFGVSLYNTSKQYQAEITIDDFVGDDDEEARRRRIDLQESITLFALTVEAAYRRVIPPTYFSISGSERTTFVLAAGVSPLTFFSRTNSMRINADEGRERMDSIANAIRAQNRFTTELDPSGMSLSWRVGISSLRSRGLEVGLYYGGTYSFNFVENGETINESTVRSLDEDDKALSFMTNRIEFRLSFLRPISRARVVDVSVDKHDGDVIIDSVSNDSNDIKDNNAVEVVDVVEENEVVDNGEEDVIIDDDIIVNESTNEVEVDNE